MHIRNISVAAAVAGALALGASRMALAQDAAPAAPASSEADVAEISQVIVTGTRIRGVAPVGSALISVDPTLVKESGLTTTNDVLNSIPSVLNIGVGNHSSGGLAINNGFSTSNSPNIHGLGVQATLSLVNGHRMFVSGTLSDVFDPNNYPMQMIQRVEVVQDGTSPIYGADAISGTVNYVLRQPEDVIETNFGEAMSKGQNYWQGTGIIGHKWGEESGHTGGFILGAQYSHQGPLAASTYPDLYNNDFSPYGGAPSSTFSSPGNILIGSTTYAVPGKQNGQSLTLSQIGPAGSANRQNLYAAAPPWGSTQIVPDNRGYNIALNYNQNITDWLQFFGDGLWVRHHTFNYTSGSVNDVAAKVPNSNPFSPCNPGHYADGVVTGPADLMAACATGSLTVNYNTLSQIGPALSVGLDKGWSTTNGFHIRLPGQWQITPQVSLNQHNQWYSNATLTTPNPASYNYFCDASTFDCSMPGAIGIIIPPYQGTANAGPILSTGRFYQLQADGPLFELPGGAVRLATGVEYNFWEAEKHTSTNTDPTRDDRAAYAELYIPIFGASNAIRGIRSLELDIAGRYDDYSDTGGTTNPKVGINWTPLQGLKLHASYGTSFRGAPIQNLGSLAPTFRTSTAPASAISPTLCPRCTDPALYGVFGANKLIYSEAMGNQNNLQPEESTSYSFGFDWAPEALPGFIAGVNWWWIKYINQVGNPEYNAGGVGAINQQYFNDHLIYNPTFFPDLAANNPLAYMEMNPRANLADPNCAAVYQKRVTTQELFNAFVACANNPSGGQSITGTTSANPNDVLAVTYYGQVNAGSTLGSGFDLNASYAWSNDWGNWKANFVGEYIPRFDVRVIQGAPTVNEAGRFGYVLKFKSRLQLGWQRNLSIGALSTNLFVNYNSKYKMDRGLLPNGVDPSYGNISSRTTEDISIVYDTGSTFDSWLSKDITLMLSAQNITNSAPPLVINSSILFDPTYGWPPGRQVQMQIAKTW